MSITHQNITFCKHLTFNHRFYRSKNSHWNNENSLAELKWTQKYLVFALNERSNLKLNLISIDFSFTKKRKKKLVFFFLQWKNTQQERKTTTRHCFTLATVRVLDFSVLRTHFSMGKFTHLSTDSSMTPTNGEMLSGELKTANVVFTRLSEFSLQRRRYAQNFTQINR